MNLDQLLALNHERYVAEVRQGLHEKKKGERGKHKRGTGRKKKNERKFTTPPVLR